MHLSRQIRGGHYPTPRSPASPTITAAQHPHPTTAYSSQGDYLSLRSPRHYFSNNTLCPTKPSLQQPLFITRLRLSGSSKMHIRPKPHHGHGWLDMSTTPVGGSRQTGAPGGEAYDRVANIRTTSTPVQLRFHSPIKAAMEEKYRVPCHILYRVRWDESPDLGQLFHSAPTQSRTVTRFLRHDLEGRVTAYKNVAVPADCYAATTAKNNTSLGRTPASRADFVRSDAGFFPFCTRWRGEHGLGVNTLDSDTVTSHIGETHGGDHSHDSQSLLRPWYFSDVTALSSLGYVPRDRDPSLVTVY
ncbi:hypothetical protein CONLIGDRAFT_649008 [Coniochaeta ligniaria NRRL 30616]|uniref:Ski2 N-terminal domain-containing protein n=1 Tax=Coniochaeta ligniaria NRRL 30616 TaxID=1408157 RepID=A0A1J7IT19_9PEZI|nr:hypothetical protein CONLIGDRAFT_649008 [Coniochaeta ligniaria NRRL 30616]